MNIERFIEQRKRKGLVQSELADGICTQATLSRFENNGQIPNLKILIQLCNRLELPLSELFPKVGIKNPEVIQLMDDAEFLLILIEYSQVEEKLSMIDVNLIENSQLKLRYYYLKAFSMIYNEDAATESLFMLNQIQLCEAQNANIIYNLLANTGYGMVYQQLNELKKAESYFNNVLDKIYDIEVEKIEDVWRLLHIIYQMSYFYAEIDELEISNALAHHVIHICSDNHVTYYLARVAVQLAENAMKSNEPKDKVLDLIHDARAYAKLNQNTIALNKLKNMEAELLKLA